MSIQEAETQFYDIFPNAEHNVIKTGITLDVRDASDNKLPLEAYKIVKTYAAAESLVERKVDPSDSTVWYYDAYPGETISVVDDGSNNGLYVVMGTQDPSQNGLTLHRVIYSDDPSSAYTLQSKIVNPSTATVNVTPDTGYYGLSAVTVRPINVSIDPDLIPSNIKNGVEIFGVTGTYTGSGGGSGDCSPTIINLKCPSTAAEWFNVFDISAYNDSSLLKRSKFAGHMPYAEFPNVTVAGPWFLNFLLYGTDNKSVSFPNLTSIITETNYAMLSSMVPSTCESASFPNLVSMNGASGSIWGLGVSSPFTLTVNANSETLSALEAHGLVYGIEGKLVTLHVSNPSITDDITIWSYVLSRDSVYEVLSKLDPNVSNKICTFWRSRESDPHEWPTGNLTVNDWPDGRIQTAYDTAVANGWIIRNLTINATSLTMVEYITYGDNAELDDYLELPCTLTNNSVVQVTVNYKDIYRGKFLSTEVTDYYPEEWRTFVHEGEFYTDLGGGEGGNRFNCQDTFDAIHNQYGTIEIGVDGDGYIYQKDVSAGNTYTNWATTSFTSTSPYHIRYYSDDYTWLREIKVYQNGISGGLTYDFVAAKDGSNIPGLYDTVSGEIYYATTSGTLIAGPALS